MKILDFFLSALCISIPIGILVITVIVGIRMRLRRANRLREALARGVFDDLETPKNISRSRRLAVVSLMGVLGTTLSIVVFALQVATKSSKLYGITIGAALIFGIIAGLAGFLNDREITRRL